MNIFLTLFTIICIVFLYSFVIFQIIYEHINNIPLNLYKYKVIFVEYKKMYGKTEYVCKCKSLFYWFSIFKRDTLEECKRDYKQYLKKSLKRRKEHKIISKKVINN